MAKCGAPTKAGGRCQRPVVTGTSRCAVHQGPWSAYGRAQQQEKEAKEKKRKIRKKR
ncbi:HGGxSTG domain-containing protein [Streptomyces sp. NPDC006691]|uniref:HGGxSTG domain-containing protein n=1 Tax=Streptomyces sp. NPDC006691 TaxID=3364757 RepID=UPI0036C078C9